MRALVLVGLLAVPARADVTLEQPAGVCSIEAVRAELAALPGAHAGHVRLASVRHAGRVEATVTIGDQARAVTARDCRELAKSVALIIVMALRDAPPQHEPAVAEPVVAEDTLVEPEPVPSVVVPSRPPEQAGARWSGALLLGGVTTLHGHAAVIAGARAGRGRWSLGLELRAEPTTELVLEDGGMVRMSRTSVTAAPCVHLGGLGLCGIVTAGRVRGRGIELADAATVTRPIVELGGRVEWRYRVAGPLALRVHADAAQALTRTRFMVDQMPVWTSESRELRLGAGVVANFP